jgi:hypothetical protein
MKKNAPAPPADDSRGRELACCKFFGVGHTMYKGVYLPSKEEYVAHHYSAENYDRFMAQSKKNIDETGRP